MLLLELSLLFHTKELVGLRSQYREKALEYTEVLNIFLLLYISSIYLVMGSLHLLTAPIKFPFPHQLLLPLVIINLISLSMSLFAFELQLTRTKLLVHVMEHSD